MKDDSLIKVVIHRGTRQIGGVCTEVFTDKARVFFDFGSPLEGEGNQDMLDIEGLTTGKQNCDAVFITHYHGDHVGEVPRILEGISVYMHKTAQRILQAQQEHKVSIGQVVWSKDIKELTVGEPVIVKELIITPLASDHSASDSLMYLVEGHNKRILITGDYRLNGYYGEQIKETFESIGHIDLMITEGTNISRLSPNYRDEKWVTDQFKRIIKDYKYVFLFTSSSNIDRIAAFSRCVPKGTYMIADKYQQELQQIVDESREEAYKSHKILYYSDYLKSNMELSGFGMVIRSGEKFLKIVKRYFEKYPNDTCLIYSMWRGYEGYPAVKEMLSCCKTVERIHVSGHITKEDLEYVIKTVAPNKLIIHHTSNDSVDKYVLEIPERTCIIKPKDGEVFSF